LVTAHANRRDRVYVLVRIGMLMLALMAAYASQPIQ
jgi:hypothetical protein